MHLVNADIWVLTETWIDRSPGPGFDAVHSPPHPTRRSSEAERYVSIWSRYPIRPVAQPTPHPRGTVAAIVDSPVGLVVVYGAVIPYAHERQLQDGSPAKPWEAHLQAIERQAGEWWSLRAEYGEPLIVAGDFNQARSGRPKAYGTTTVRAALSEALNAVGLTCHTEADFVTSAGLDRSAVDHICSTLELTPARDAWVLGRRDSSGTTLSDHALVAIDLARGDRETA